MYKYFSLGVRGLFVLLHFRKVMSCFLSVKKKRDRKPPLRYRQCSEQQQKCDRKSGGRDNRLHEEHTALPYIAVRLDSSITHIIHSAVVVFFLLFLGLDMRCLRRGTRYIPDTLVFLSLEESDWLLSLARSQLGSFLLREARLYFV